MKSLERLIGLLPIPLLIAAAVVFAVAWVTKELRSLTGWGATMRDAHFQVSAFLVLLSVVGYYGLGAIWRNRVPGSQSEHAIFVARIDGDPKGVVQKHTVESLQTAFSQTETHRHVKVRPLLTELFMYVKRRIETETQRSGFLQTPAMHARGLTDFVVSVPNWKTTSTASNRGTQVDAEPISAAEGEDAAAAR